MAHSNGKTDANRLGAGRKLGLRETNTTKKLDGNCGHSSLNRVTPKELWRCVTVLYQYKRKRCVVLIEEMAQKGVVLGSEMFGPKYIKCELLMLMQ